MNSENSKKGFIIGGSVMALLAVTFLGGPILSASAWKSTTIDAANTVIDKVNASNRDISNYSSKLQPSDDDYAKLIAAYDSQMKVVEDAKGNLKDVGGISIIDITGVYTKAQDSRKELAAAYDALLSLDKVGSERAKAEREVMALTSSEEPQNDAEAKAFVDNMKQAAKKVADFANSANGTDYDKKSATAFTKLADALEAAYSATDDMAATTAQEQVDAAVQEIDALQDEGDGAEKAFQKKIDDTIDRLNSAVKSLE